MPRPTKCTDVVVKTILAALREGNFREVAAEAAGIDPGTLMRWMKRKGEPYASSFRRALLAAERGAESLLVKRQMAFGKKDARANQYLLERRFPERWARRDRVELSGSVNRADLSLLTDLEVEQWMALQVKAAGGR